jgi:hypothetical protein
MSLINQQKDLESFSDQALLQEAMQPMRGYPPFLVASEIQRRQQDRARVQQQTMAAQAEAPPVAMQQASQFASQMAPEAALQPDMGQMQPEAGMDMAAPMMDSAAPAEPVGIMGAAPVQAMSSGGEVKRMQEGKGVPDDPFYRFGSFLTRVPSMIPLRRSEVGLVRSIEQIEKAGGDASALRAELARLKGTPVPAIGEAPVATPSSAPGIASIPAENVDLASIVNPPQGSYLRGVPVGGSTVTETPPAPPVARATAPRAAAPAGIEQLQEVAVTGKRTDPYYLEAAGEMYKFAPNREDFERRSRAETLVGLGEIIGGATQRGDIAKGLAALTRQRLAGEREMQREERDFRMAMMGLRSQERAETRAEARELASIARDEGRFKIETDLKIRELDMRRIALREEAATRAAAAKNDAERLAIQRRAADLDEKLLADRQDLLKAQADYYRGKGTSALPFGGQNQFATAQDISAGLGQ